jgi:hypothetical protein
LEVCSSTKTAICKEVFWLKKAGKEFEIGAISTDMGIFLQWIPKITMIL